MHDSKAVSLAILMADAFGCPTADGVDDVGCAFDGTEAILQTMTEGVDETSIRHTWFQPFVQRRIGRVGIAPGFAAVFGEGEGRACILDPVRCP
jgi:hypothetical protein